MIAMWQQLIGDGPRAEDYEAWMTQTIESSFTKDELDKMTPAERQRAESRLRISKIIVSAVIEAARSEQAKGRHPCELLTDIAQFTALAVGSLIQMIFEEQHRLGAAMTIANLMGGDVVNYSGISEAHKKGIKKHDA
ncbi:MAG: hypothetical protein SFX19_09965 [Alphaproteobacteria bacterium]|nr:hypothetical protein [Alphaproteobacteria bacterium]